MRQSPLWLTGKSLEFILPNGTMLGSPPVHIHHIHITHNTMWKRKPAITYRTGEDDLTWWEQPVERAGEMWGKKSHSVWFEGHGDAQCRDAEGGTECLMETFPEGFGMQVQRSAWAITATVCMTAVASQ